jgi:REP element-mobilizing transposase RayT
LLIRVPPKLALSDVLRSVKAGSAKWMNDNVARNREFDWQDGFAAFSVSHSLLSRVGEYVENQEEHHRRKNFREELMSLLKRHGIDFDERYLPG